MIIALMSIFAALVLLLLTPAERETTPTTRSPRDPSPWLRAALLGAACVGLLGLMVIVAGGVPGFIDGRAVAAYDHAALSRLGHMVTDHARSLGEGDSVTRAALVQQTFGAAMLAAFAVVQRNRRR